MYFSQIFHMFFKGLQPCLSCSKPNENFVNNYCQLLNKDIFNPGNFCICFLMTETIITCTWICSLKKLIFILQELQLYTCRYSCTNIFFYQSTLQSPLYIICQCLDSIVTNIAPTGINRLQPLTACSNMQQYRLTNQLTATTPTEIQLLKVDEENLLLLRTGSLNPSPQIINYIIVIITVHSQFELLYGIQNQSDSSFIYSELL